MKRVVIFFLTGFLLIAAIGITGCTSSQKTTVTPVSTPQPVAPISTPVAPVSTPIPPVITQAAPVSTPPPVVKAQQDKTTMGEQNAAKKALQYLRYSAFSKEGLIKQLEFEGFSHQEAVYGTDQTGANWNEQAAKKAKQYLDYSAFSRDGLIKQLEFEGFTSSQAAYGVQAVGY
jgi:hypothetical protein